MEIGDMVWCYIDPENMPVTRRTQRTSHFRMIGRSDDQIILALPEGPNRGWRLIRSECAEFSVPSQYVGRLCWGLLSVSVFEANPLRPSFSVDGVASDEAVDASLEARGRVRRT